MMVLLVSSCREAQLTMLSYAMSCYCCSANLGTVLMCVFRVSPSCALGLCLCPMAECGGADILAQGSGRNSNSLLPGVRSAALAQELVAAQNVRFAAAH